MRDGARRAVRVGRCAWDGAPGVGYGWLTVRVARRETTGSETSGSSATSSLPDPATLGYEQARDELVSIVARLESGASTLEESLALWERGEALAARCQQWLDGARARLTAARGGPEDGSTPGDGDTSAGAGASDSGERDGR